MPDDAGPQRRTRGEAGLIAKHIERAQLQEWLGKLHEPALERLREPAVSGVAIGNERVVPEGHSGRR